MPADGASPHVFTEPLPRTLAGESEECWECERPLARHEGPPSPRGYEYTVREIAEALILVGRGMSYAGAGREIRGLGTRPRRRTSRHRRRHQDSRTVASWVEVFAPPLFEAFRPREWPAVVALDAQPFYVGGRTNEEGRLMQGGTPVFHVFGAMGYEDYEAPVKLVGLQSFPGFGLRQGRPCWVEFLRGLKHELAGTPRQFVCDADPDIEAAIREVWPPDQPGAPEVFLCHHHLHERVKATVARQFPIGDPLRDAAQAAFDNSGAWRTFVAMVEEIRPERRASAIRNWLRHNQARVAYQLAHRVGHLTDTAAIEDYLQLVRRQIGFRRASLRNRRRLDRLLMLMMLQQRAPASRSAYSHVIREQLLARGGKAPPQRSLDDRGGRGSLRLVTAPPRRPRPSPAAAAQPSPPEDEEEIPF